jgi:peptidoglycan/xylan/chitin deacetylase (PgdA/CDA1 family)
MRRTLWMFTMSLGLMACVPITPSPTASPAPVVVQVETFTPTARPSPSASPTFTPTALPPTATLEPTPIWPTPDAVAATRRVRLPILMYHYIEPWPAEADEIRRGLTVRPEDFEAQLNYLHEHGFTIVSLYDLINALALGTPLPDHAVVLTFDDGYRSLMDYAVPAMQAYGDTGTVFVITELMDKELPQYLTWPQAEALFAQGWSIESHTKTHDELPGTGRDFQIYQLLGALQTIEAHTGHTPRFLCYPAGKYDDVSIQIARELNLWGAVTTQFSRTHTLADQFTWGRVRVDGRGTLQDFINAVAGGE